MASAVTSQKVASTMAIDVWDHDPDTASALIVSPDAGTTKRYVALRDYELFAVKAMATVATTGITLLDIVAATDAAGTDVTTVVSSGTVAANAVGETAFVECTAAQVKEQGDSSGKVFTHVGARLTLGNSGDECAVMYLRTGSKFPTRGLTPATT